MKTAETQKAEMYSMLRHAENKGVCLYLEGEKASPGEIVNRYCLNEESIYMPDYVLDEKGELKELRYDKIELC